MSSTHARIATLLGCLAAAPAAISAQQAQRVPLLELLPGSTRAMGLGNAFVAGDGPEAVFYNPAQVGIGRGTAFSIHHVDRYSALGSLATNTTLLGVSVGLGVQYLEYHTPVYFGNSSNPFQSPVDSRSSGLEATLAGAIERKGMRIGIGAKYVQNQLPTGRRSAPALEIGAATDVRGVTVALALTDGGTLDFGDYSGRLRLPTRLTAGGMISNETIGTWFDMTASASISVEEGGRFIPAGGLEVSYFPVNGWSFVARAGAHGRSQLIPGHEPIMAFGGTMGVDRLALDYAFQPSSHGSGAGHRVGVRIRP